MPEATYKDLRRLSDITLKNEFVSVYALVTAKEYKYKIPTFGVGIYCDDKAFSYGFTKRDRCEAFVKVLCNHLTNYIATLKKAEPHETIDSMAMVYVVPDKTSFVSLTLTMKDFEIKFKVFEKNNGLAIRQVVEINTQEMYDRNYYGRKSLMIDKLSVLLNTFEEFSKHLVDRPVMP